MDLDVEEPNCYIFSEQDGHAPKEVHRPVPVIDSTKCTLCGNCMRLCEFHAIAVLPKEVMIFEELCHGCGACTVLCPEKAISERGHLVGEIIRSSGNGFDLVYGRLRVGEASAVPLIRAVKEEIPKDHDAILDCPPGTACTSVESMRGADLCVLVTEPTPFGLHDLKLALEVAKSLKVKAAVFVNKDGLPGPSIDEFCNSKNIPIVGRLPLDRSIAETYSRGQLISSSGPFMRSFEELRDKIFHGGSA